MAGYWLSSIFACLWTLAEKERSQYPVILTEQTWSIKDLSCMAFGEILLVGYSG